ncbi:hypothetical protein F4808DRAFT_474122 [Astrocystis sublimbata]|nr:hypothetical protein F4808DRAFT_474122 [Astrocystis sublimbata]
MSSRQLRPRATGQLANPGEAGPANNNTAASGYTEQHVEYESSQNRSMKCQRRYDSQHVLKDLDLDWSWWEKVGDSWTQRNPEDSGKIGRAEEENSRIPEATAGEVTANDRSPSRVRYASSNVSVHEQPNAIEEAPIATGSEANPATELTKEVNWNAEEYPVADPDLFIQTLMDGGKYTVEVSISSSKDKASSVSRKIESAEAALEQDQWVADNPQRFKLEFEWIDKLVGAWLEDAQLQDSKESEGPGEAVKALTASITLQAMQSGLNPGAFWFIWSEGMQAAGLMSCSSNE